MALNLNKVGEEKATPSIEKKGLNLSKSDDSAKGGLNLSKSGDSAKGGVNLSKDKLQTDSTATVTEIQNNDKKKSPLMLIVILAVLALGIFWFVNSSENENQAAPVVNEAPAVSNDSETPQTEVASDAVQTEQPIATSSSTQEAPTNAEPVNSTNANTKINKNSSVSKNNDSSNSVNQGTIEEKAKQVMDGVFGNGTDRKSALGSEYEAIQAKVNEMYRNR
jgi:hypothetical protein